MSKIEQLEKQYPNLSLSMIDLAKLLDKTKSKKYTPIICKILDDVLQIYEGDSEYIHRVNHVQNALKDANIETANMSPQYMLIIKYFLDNVPPHTLETISDLIDYGERNLLPTKDILKYKSISEIKNDITFASLKDSEKNLSNQIFKEFENETWLAVRPLTYKASIKYGASTKWCTTSRYEKEYFAKYWDRGILVYFINKTNGYKFAGYKGIKNSDELSFWDAADNRVDSLDIDCDSFLYDIIKNVFKSKKSNSDLCDFELKEKVSLECKYVLYDNDLRKDYIRYDEEVPQPIPNEMVYEVRNIEAGLNNNVTITDTTYLMNTEATRTVRV